MNDFATNNGYNVDLLTVPEAAKLLRISRNLAYDLVAQQKLPAVRFGRVIRVPRYSLEEWIAAQTTKRVETKTLSSPHDCSTRREGLSAAEGASDASVSEPEAPR